MKKIRKQFLAAVVSAVMFTSSMPMSFIHAANVQETEGIKLQTIVIDNNGNDWTTESWGGATMTPNTNWTVLDAQDYYENGTLNFEVKNNGSGTVKFYMGLISRHHGESTRICWTDMDKYKDDIYATSEWRSYSLPLKDLVDAYADTDFTLEYLWYVAAGAVPQGTTVSFRNMTITSSDDERQYPMVKVNQVGYLSNSAKSARITYFEKFGSLNGKTWELVNAETEEVVLSGTLENGNLEAEFSGEIIHEIHFDEITQAGTYYIRVPNANLNDARSPRDIADGLELDTLRSVSFKIGANVYEDMLCDMTKYYYYQRQGIEIEEKYAGVFARENLHPDDVTVKRWSDRDNPNAETFDVSGGWYDAGDYGKYTSPGAKSVEDLLLAYELYPDVLNGLSMQIPETDPSHALYVEAPGILAEIKWELDMLMKLEHNSKDGSFYTAANYKDGVIYLEDTLYSTSNHNSPESERDLRCHLATADMAGVLAHAYIIYKDYPVYADFAEQCLETAQRSWDWATDPSNTKNMSIGAANRTYTFPQDELDRSMFYAAGTLYRALSDAGEDASEYEDYLLANRNTENVLRCFQGDSIAYSQSFLGFFHYLYKNENADSQMMETFSKYESWRQRYMAVDNWGLTMPTWGFWWGSNKYVARSAMTFVLGDMIMYGSAREDAVQRVGQHLDYLLGNNPVSFSYVSGWGENSVENIYSGIYTNAARLDPYQCPSGYVTEGTNSHNNPHLSKFIGKCYIDSDSEYTTNENTIYINAATILLTASYMDALASESVKGDVNADGKFSVADIVLMQKWLVGMKDVELVDSEAGELCVDGSLNVFDLALMKQLLLS